MRQAPDTKCCSVGITRNCDRHHWYQLLQRGHYSKMRQAPLIPSAAAWALQETAIGTTDTNCCSVGITGNRQARLIPTAVHNLSSGSDHESQLKTLLNEPYRIWRVGEVILRIWDKTTWSNTAHSPLLRPVHPRWHVHHRNITNVGAVLYRVIHKSLRDFRTRLRNNQDRHGRKEHINR